MADENTKYSVIEYFYKKYKDVEVDTYMCTKSNQPDEDKLLIINNMYNGYEPYCCTRSACTYKEVNKYEHFIKELVFLGIIKKEDVKYYTDNKNDAENIITEFIIRKYFIKVKNNHKNCIIEKIYLLFDKENDDVYVLLYEEVISEFKSKKKQQIIENDPNRHLHSLRKDFIHKY